MIFPIFLLITFHISMYRADKLQCKTFEEVLKSDSKAGLKTIGLDPQTINVGAQFRINYGKRYRVLPNSIGGKIYSFQYELSDEVIKDQFEFHRTLIHKIRSIIFPRFEIHCLLDNKESYIIYKSDTTSSEEINSPHFAGYDEIRKVLLGALALFRVLGENEAIILLSEIDSIQIFGSGAVTIDPFILMSVYRKGGFGYYDSVELALADSIPSEGASVVYNDLHIEFGKVEAQGRWNKFSYLTWMIQTMTKISSSDPQLNEEGLLSKFTAKTENVKEAGERSWKELKEFVESFGQKEALAEFLNDSQAGSSTTACSATTSNPQFSPRAKSPDKIPKTPPPTKTRSRVNKKTLQAPDLPRRPTKNIRSRSPSAGNPKKKASKSPQRGDMDDT